MFLTLIGQSLRFQKTSESGNVFLAIFGAIALVGLLGASIMTFMKGPLSTSVRLTKMNTAENQMQIGAQVAVMATASRPDNGDCDSDGTVEPVPFRSPTTEDVPTGGGLVPLTVGISKKDPWGTEYGYCVWNQGSTTTGAGCEPNMLEGTGGAGYTVYPVVALISAGPDKLFTTTCRSFADADVVVNGNLLDPTDLPMVSKAAETDDDIITSFTYEEATSASGGLWNLKSTDAGTAVINKSIETSGVANLKGGVLLPDKSFITCDASTAGVMAKNGTTGIEICDGAGTWTAITGGGVTGNNLVLTPVVSSGMNVVGTCGTATCYSSNVTFTLTNKAATTSVVLATSLSNTQHFEFVSNGCNGQTLATNADCQMVVRAKATGNVSYTGTLNITGGNSPFATLDGTASSFPGCNAGGQAPGGYYIACGVSGSYNLIVTPSGCTGGNTNPTCAGGNTDMYGIQASPAIDLSPYIAGCCSTSDGAQNTANLMAYTIGPANFPATSYCSGLVYAGFDDWYLPSSGELVSYLYPNRAAVGMASGNYWSSSPENINLGIWYYMMTNGAIQPVYGTNVGLYTRCMRRDPAVVVNPTVDNTPSTISFATSYGAPAVTRTSNTITLLNITQPISISISGGIGAQFSKNGGPYTSTPTTAVHGDTITLQATAPALGQESVVTVTTGSSSTNWQVRTPGNNTIRVFTTSSVYYPNFGGPGGGDSTCTARAAAVGLPGAWTAVMTGALSPLAERLPWNWSTLRNMNGATVASSLADFLDGSISAPMNYSESGAQTASGLIWTGVNIGSSPLVGHSGGSTCSSWTYGGAGQTGASGAIGDSSLVGSSGYLQNTALSCAGQVRLLCMESNAAGADLDPDAVSIPPAVTFISGGTGTSVTVTVAGVTDEVSVSIVPSAGVASITKGGVNLNATSTTAGLNETLIFTMEAPTILGTKNTATINIGPDSYTWWVGYADSAREAKVFVSSTVYAAGQLNAVTGADAICGTLASNAPGLPSKWKALLSNSTTDAYNRIPWNWGTLKTVTGVTVADGGITDLFDGTFDNPINVNQNGGASTSHVWTGTNSKGLKYYPGQTTAQYWAYDWTAVNCCGASPASYGLSVSTTGGIYHNTTNSDEYKAIYCVEDVDDAVVDNIPNAINLNYAVQVPVSSRQTSEAVIIGGMTAGVTTTLTVPATGGSPTFKVNGGAEVTSGSIKNGDSIVFLMDAPASGNSSNRMAITAGGTIIGYWRVWTGDTSGSIVKRIFPYNFSSSPGWGNMGGLVGADTMCTNAASSAGLGGSWKAILSGKNEADYAINRVGYNWSSLQRTDGVDVVYAGNLWKTDVTPLLAPVVRNVTNTGNISNNILTATNSFGKSTNATDNGTCADFASGDGSYTVTMGASGTNATQWMQNGSSQTCGYQYYVPNYMYCIEQ